MTPAHHLWTVARGGLIGAAEVLPGVSGGTIALVTGVYERAVRSAGHLLSGLRLLTTDRVRAREQLALVSWRLLLLLLLGMVPAALVAARLVAPLLEEHPVRTTAFFLGMTSAALVVPLSMVGPRWRARDVAVAVAVAAAVFGVVGLPPQQLVPTWPVVLLGAALAACALALPGTSGSFLLLTLGLYHPTLAAVNDRDLGYVAVFAAGVLLGLGVFVRGLQWLLEHRRRITLVVLTGVVLGALRGLWPWQGEDRSLLAPDDGLPGAALLWLGGAVLVLALFWVSRRVASVEAATDPGTPTVG